MANAWYGRTTQQEDGLHYHVYQPLPDPNNPDMIIMYKADPEPIGSRTTANREAKESGLPWLGVRAMVQQCRSPLCGRLHIQRIAQRVRAQIEAEELSQNPPSAED